MGPLVFAIIGIAVASVVGWLIIRAGSAATKRTLRDQIDRDRRAAEIREEKLKEAESE